MIDEQQLDFYKNNGYLHLEKCFTDAECADVAHEADAMIAHVSTRQSLEATWAGAWREQIDAVWDVDRSSVLSVHNMQFASAVFTRLMSDDRLAGIASDVIGPDVVLHHMKLHNKPARRGSPFPLHQDYPYFPHEGASMTAAILHLDDADMEGGCFCVVPGSHRAGPLEARADGSHYLSPDEWPLSRATPLPARRGDVLLLHYMTIHGSYPNASEHDRRIVLIQYRAPDDRPLVEKHRSPGQGTVVRGRNFSWFDPTPGH